jgi:response regulator RpfG family c-di-GMP phosphodiesterase
MDSKPRILAVDDEPRGVELIERTLRELAEVDTAATGDEAWERFQAHDYHLVISDQRMPGISGVELLTRVADARPITGRVLLTGYADIAATIEAINRGRIHAYLNKPCPPDQLRMIAGSVLARVRAERENAVLLAELRERNQELEEVISSLRRETQGMIEAATAETAGAVAVRVAAPLAALRKVASELETDTARRLLVELEAIETATQPLNRQIEPAQTLD